MVRRSCSKQVKSGPMDRGPMRSDFPCCRVSNDGEDRGSNRMGQGEPVLDDDTEVRSRLKEPGAVRRSCPRNGSTKIAFTREVACCRPSGAVVSSPFGKRIPASIPASKEPSMRNPVHHRPVLVGSAGARSPSSAASVSWQFAYSVQSTRRPRSGRSFVNTTVALPLVQFVSPPSCICDTGPCKLGR